ncbi:DUF5309 family protein [Paenibacillus sp. FSL E2-0274]|uniref:SU10 major capsid protein n=1 Tax=Paenibacillus TaxID=44249 RepID=UPI00096C435F|nr:DUF5309 family protein [Paenibacillus odorifer]OME21582.1 hypothetical protein BSK57_19750 [Paenibacillus odorifer]OME31793.1 hypothetical protein BSK63_14690 [Paenibacillus odorifer]
MPKVYNSSIVGKRESVVDEILLLNQHQTPLLNLLGFAEPINAVEHVWYEDEMFPDETSTTESALVGATSIVVADVTPFRVDSVIKIADEMLKVTAIDAGIKTLTVTRGYASTTAAAVASGARVEFQFDEGVEGADARAARYKARVRKSNLTQIFTDTVDLSGTAQAIAQYGIDNLYEHEKQKKQLELALQLEKAAINGIAYENGQVRQMRGIRQFIKSNVTNVGGALTLGAINTLAQTIYEAGGFANGGDYKVMVAAKQKMALSGTDSNKITLTRGENTRGQSVEKIVTDFGEFEVALNQNLAPDELLLVDANRIKIHPLATREFGHTYLGLVGDSMKGQIVGEYTLALEQEKAHGRLKGLS